MAVEAKEIIPEGRDLRPYWEVSDPEKSLVTYRVDKARNGFAFFSIYPSNGGLPKELDQMFTRATNAVEAVVRYLKEAKPTQAVKNLETHQRIAEKKAKEKV